MLGLSGDPLKRCMVVGVFLVGLARIWQEVLDGDRRAVGDLADLPLEDPLGQDALLVVAVVPPSLQLWMVASTPHVGLPAVGNDEDAHYVPKQ